MFFFIWQHQAIRGRLWEGINTILSTASTTSKHGRMRPFAFTISSTGVGETGLNTSGRGSDCHATLADFTLNENTCRYLSGKTKINLKGKAQEKTHQRTQEDNLQFSCILDDDGILWSVFQRDVDTWLFLSKNTVLLQWQCGQNTFSWLLEKQRVLSSFFSVTLAYQI